VPAVNRTFAGWETRIDRWSTSTQRRFKTLGPELQRQWRSGDLNGVAGTIDRILGAGGRVEPVLGSALRVFRDAGRIFKNDIVPAGKDIAKFAVPALGALADVTGFFGTHSGMIRAGFEAFLVWKTATGVAGIIDSVSRALRGLAVAETAEAEARGVGTGASVARNPAVAAVGRGAIVYAGTDVALHAAYAPFYHGDPSGSKRAGRGASSVAVGAGIGATVGSIIPGAGNVVGAVLGGLAGGTVEGINQAFFGGGGSDAAFRRMQFLKRHQNELPAVTRGALDRFIERGVTPNAWSDMAAGRAPATGGGVKIFDLRGSTFQGVQDPKGLQDKLTKLSHEQGERD
jgi:hypothetical protein